MYKLLSFSYFHLPLPSYAVAYNLGAHRLSLSLLLVAGGMICELATRTVSEAVGGTEFDKIIADFLSTEFEKLGKKSDVSIFVWS